MFWRKRSGWQKGILAALFMFCAAIVLALATTALRYDGTCLKLGLPGLSAGGAEPCTFMQYISTEVGFTAIIIAALLKEFWWTIAPFFTIAAGVGHMAEKWSRA